MSEYSFESRSGESVPEFSPGNLTLAECSPARSVTMPFESDSEEANALRGAIGFLFALITSYDELIAAASAESGTAAGAENTQQ
jgi:AMMECR1 domain-containing protein